MDDTVDDLVSTFGPKLEYFEDKVKDDDSIALNVPLLKRIVKNFGIKKLSREILSNDIPWQKRILVEMDKYSCVQCGKSYKSRLGCKYHVTGKCPKNKAFFSCLLCDFNSSATSIMEDHIRKTHLGEKGTFGRVTVKVVVRDLGILERNNI